MKMVDIREAIRQQLLAVSCSARVQGLEIVTDFGPGFAVYFAAIGFQNTINKITHLNTRTAIAAVQHARSMVSIVREK